MRNVVKGLIGLVAISGFVFPACSAQNTDSVDEPTREVEQALFCLVGSDCHNRGLVCCNNQCVSLQDNCGTCGHQCLPGAECGSQNGVYRCLGYDNNDWCIAGSNTDICVGLTCCDYLYLDLCHNLQNDPDNCGSCGHACPTVPGGTHGNWSCVSGTCKQDCYNDGTGTYDHGYCADNSVCNVQTGFCEVKNCNSINDCTDGGGNWKAQWNTDAPQGHPGCCGGKCVDLSQDRLNCGVCGNVANNTGEYGCCTHKDWANSCGGSWSTAVSTNSGDWPGFGFGCSAKCSALANSSAVSFGKAKDDPY